MGLPFELARRYLKLMARFEVFDSDEALRAVFKASAEIAPYADTLPDADSKEARIKIVTALLTDRSVLVIFRNVLLTEVQAEDERSRQLRELIPEVAGALNRADEYRKLAREFESLVPASKRSNPLLFLSYARSDEGIVEVTYRDLERAGFRPWMDQKDILGGEHFDSAIIKAINAADSSCSFSRRILLAEEE